MNPLIPMMAITGNPTNKQLEKMLASFKAVGIDAVMLYPRSGLEVEYMSEDWRRLVEYVLQTAEQLGMRIWLYDEFNWPSGSCKNTVIEQDPAFAAMRFVCEDGKVRVESMPRGDAQRVFQPFDSDMLNPAVVRCFINLTHEKYYKWFGHYFGNVIAGIFTDEPSFIYTANAPGMYPYYEGIEEDYAAQSGSVLREDMLAYHNGEDTPHFPGLLYWLAGKRFKKVFMDQIADWCRAHGLPLTGHMMEDEPPLHGLRTTGNWFEAVEVMDVPGVDEIPTRMGVNADMLFCMIENARLNGKPHAMAELFALGPCSMPYARRRQMLWYAAAHGVDHFFIAISHLDGKGNVRKPDFYDNFNYHNPDFDGVALLTEDAKKAAAFAQKRTTATVGIRLPYALYIYALGMRRGEDLEHAFEKLLDGLTERQITWRILREEEAAEDCRFVVRFENDGLFEESGNVLYQTVADTVAAAAKQHGGVYVTDADGNLLKNIRLKTYEDGSILVLDRENEPKGKRTCILHTADKATAFTLESYGLQVFEGGILKEEEHLCGEEIPLANIVATPLADNILRPQFFKKDTFSFALSAPLTVKVHRRIYPDENGTVAIDGNTVVFDSPCDALTSCFSHLYRTATVTLSAGEHTVYTDMTDYGYLPAVLLTGKFPFEDTFFGKLEVTGTLTVPADAKRAVLTMNDPLLYVTAAIDGEQIAACAFAPYRFEIPQQYFGKTQKVTFTFHTTQAPLFGDLRGWEQQGIFATAWADTPKSTAETLRVDTLALRSVIQ